MSTETDTASACSHCGFPLPKHGGGLRHYGTHTAHQESECLDLLRAHIRSLAAERDQWRSLYRRAVNEANGLTNYVEDRPELRRAERNLTAIEAEARGLPAIRATTPKDHP